MLTVALRSMPNDYLYKKPDLLLCKGKFQIFIWTKGCQWVITSESLSISLDGPPQTAKCTISQSTLSQTSKKNKWLQSKRRVLCFCSEAFLFCYFHLVGRLQNGNGSFENPSLCWSWRLLGQGGKIGPFLWHTGLLSALVYQPATTHHHPPTLVQGHKEPDLVSGH